MIRVLVLVPSEFNCFSKFERKVNRITQSFSEFTVVYPEDNNKLVQKLFENRENVTLEANKNWDISSITHAIVFDDGEVFPEELAELKNHSVPVRVINISITRVVNIKKEEKYQGIKSTPNFEYIGRGSYWGNPYSMYEEGDDRDEVIRKYRYDFEFDKFINIEKSKVYDLAGKRLGCFCKPAACHGDVLAEYLNSWDDGK
ncbi:MAG: hypothetical protein OI74_02920 [Gammaproteobacteria bacterium (ex Lamellibrachia satsuma)]|nr:MAG: DUF4326 domain-containing protein [Gammaproteobacteria bacterium (ex Lamellibrachia satsuma)]RRS35191.1 MAG: hypothetical protein OI74_02920 [Gammaproteobacteria bacterium (ex Lamellibrachia satsuma)]RRS36201.1 MAG: hypothetical protein NV67_08335 [Gammaproteobacteria bacterium (ex Lamellibrachia satsuma)]